MCSHFFLSQGNLNEFNIPFFYVHVTDGVASISLVTYYSYTLDCICV